MHSESTPTTIPAIKPALRFSLGALSKKFFLLLAAYYLVSAGALFYVQRSPALWPWLFVILLVHFILVGGWLDMLLKLYDGQQLQMRLLFGKVRQFWKYISVTALIAITVGAALGATAFVVGVSVFLLSAATAIIGFKAGHLTPQLTFVIFGIPHITVLAYLLTRLGFCSLAIADRDCGPIEALKYSWQITRGHVYRSIVFFGAILAATVILTLPGAAAPVICGLLGNADFAELLWRMDVYIVFPVVAVFCSLAGAHCYKQLATVGKDLGWSPSGTRVFKDAGILTGGVLGLLSCIACLAVPYLFIGLALCFAAQDTTDSRILRMCDLAVRMKPNSRLAYALRGASYYDLREFSKAVNDLTEEIEMRDRRSLLDPRASVLETRGSAYYHLGKYKSAIDDWNEALRLRTNAINRHRGISLARAYAGRSDTLYYLGDYDKAINDAKRAAELDPNNARYRNSLGWLRALVGSTKDQYQQALDDCNAAIRLDNKIPNHYDSRAYVYAKLGQYQQAIDDTKSA